MCWGSPYSIDYECTRSRGRFHIDHTQFGFLALHIQLIAGLTRPLLLSETVVRSKRLLWAHQHGISLRLIEPGKPNPNAHIDSFNGRLSDEYLNKLLFLSLAHAHAVIDTWREY